LACGGSADDKTPPPEDTTQTDTPSQADTITDVGLTPEPDAAGPPAPDTTDPSTSDTTEPPVEDTTQPPVEDTTEPPVEDTTEPPAPDTTEPPVPDTTEPPVPDTTEPPEPTEITWTTHIEKIINSRCGPCHTTQSKGALKITGYETMKQASPKCYADLNVAQSIKMKVQPNPGCKNKMPPNNKPQLTPTQLQQIIDWVDAGYPE